MGRKSTGTTRILQNADGKPQWHAKWTLANGTRTDWRPIDPNIKLDDKAGADACAARMAPKVRAASANDGKGETCNGYFARLAKARASGGIGSATKDGYQWTKWIAPRLGTLPITAPREALAEAIEDVRNALDAQVTKRLKEGLDAGMSGKNAECIWSILRTTFKATFSSRDRSLHVRTDDPSAGIKPPLGSPDRAKTFLYPVEVTALLACERVPREWRETYAVATYTYVRPEELEALTWKDVDFTAGTVSVNKAMDGRTHKPKPLPKTDAAVRDVPIEPALIPLLKAMHKRRASDDAPVVPVLRTLTDRYRAKHFRDDLKLAGVKRARLTADTLTLRPVDFRSCRDTGITWLALPRGGQPGLSLSAMQRRCGHTDIKQTNSYVKLAEDLSGSIGEPFPPIPPGLLSGSAGSGSGSSGESTRIARGRIRGRFAARIATEGQCCTATRTRPAAPPRGRRPSPSP